MFISLLIMLGVMFGAMVLSGSYEPPTLPKYIREKDAIYQWGISKATFIRARKNGLPFVRHGAFVCYKPEDLEAHFCKPRSWKAATPKGKGAQNND